MYAVGSILHFLLLIFILLLIARFIVDWVQVFARQWVPHGPALVVLEAVYSTHRPADQGGTPAPAPDQARWHGARPEPDGRADHLLPAVVPRERDFPALIM